MSFSSARLLVLTPLALLGCKNEAPAATAAERPLSAESESVESSPTAPEPELPAVQAGRPLDSKGENFLVSDFENESLDHALGGTWVTSSDPHNLGTTLAPSPLVVSDGGAEGSKFGLRIHGHFGKNVEPWPYADVRAPFDRTDLSTFTAVRFWAKGDGKKYVLAIVRTAVADYSHYRATFVAPKEWTLVELPLSSFVQPDWGKPRPIDWRDAEAFSFQPDASLNDESYDLSIDKVELIVPGPD